MEAMLVSIKKAPMRQIKVSIAMLAALLLAAILMTACSNNNPQDLLVGRWEYVSTTNLHIPPGSAFTSALIYYNDGSGRRETVLHGQTIHSQFDWHIESDNVLVKTNWPLPGFTITPPQSIEVEFRGNYVTFFYDSSLAIDPSSPVFAIFRRSSIATAHEDNGNVGLVGRWQRDATDTPFDVVFEFRRNGTGVWTTIFFDDWDEDLFTWNATQDRLTIDFLDLWGEDIFNYSISTDGSMLTLYTSGWTDNFTRLDEG